MTAEQRKALKGRNLDAEIEEKLAMIADGEKTVAELKVKADELEWDANRLSTIIIQRKMDLSVLDQMEEAFHAAVTMFSIHYRHEIKTGQHDGKSVGHLLRKYLNRERNLRNWPGWRFSLARWLTAPWIDEDCHIYNQTTRKPSQIRGNDNG